MDKNQLNRLANKVSEEYIKFLNENNDYTNESQKDLVEAIVKFSANTTAMMLHEYEKFKTSNS